MPRLRVVSTFLALAGSRIATWTAPAGDPGTKRNFDLPADEAAATWALKVDEYVSWRTALDVNKQLTGYSFQEPRTFSPSAEFGF